MQRIRKKKRIHAIIWYYALSQISKLHIFLVIWCFAFCFLCRRIFFLFLASIFGFTTLKLIDDITFSQNTYHILYGLKISLTFFLSSISISILLVRLSPKLCKISAKYTNEESVKMNVAFSIWFGHHVYPMQANCLCNMILMQRSAACHTQHINNGQKKKERKKKTCTHPQAIYMHGRFDKPHEDCNEIVGRLVGWLFVQFNMPEILIKCFTTLLGHKRPASVKRQPMDKERKREKQHTHRCMTAQFTRTKCPCAKARSILNARNTNSSARCAH